MWLNARSVPVEYYILRITAPIAGRHSESQVVGYLADLPIFSPVMDSFGDRYDYVGLAPRLGDGRFDVESLSPGEWIVEPGLIYTSENGKR
ncbi:hypothetical protein A9174_19750 [Mesorhizobium loti NZP2037]|nr:hypothetical protein [Mesorhizobium loti]ANN58759.1 hypothetical protein A9174_19750 [Mesorhizobium loti NZP2037]